jgi:hypothetical protein
VINCLTGCFACSSPIHHDETVEAKAGGICDAGHSWSLARGTSRWAGQTNRPGNRLKTRRKAQNCDGHHSFCSNRDATTCVVEVNGGACARGRLS